MLSIYFYSPIDKSPFLITSFQEKYSASDFNTEKFFCTAVRENNTNIMGNEK